MHMHRLSMKWGHALGIGHFQLRKISHSQNVMADARIY